MKMMVWRGSVLSNKSWMFILRWLELVLTLVPACVVLESSSVVVVVWVSRCCYKWQMTLSMLCITHTPPHHYCYTPSSNSVKSVLYPDCRLLKLICVFFNLNSYTLSCNICNATLKIVLDFEPGREKFRKLNNSWYKFVHRPDPSRHGRHGAEIGLGWLENIKLVNGVIWCL